MMISAAEAKKLSGPKCDDFLKEIEKSIVAAAESGKSQVVMRSKPYDRWLYGDTIGTEERKAVDKLRELGYEVDLLYREMQFVDMGLRIKW